MKKVLLSLWILSIPAGLKSQVIDSTEFAFGGYIKTDFINTWYMNGEVGSESPLRDFHLPSQIPIGPRDENFGMDFHVKESRFNFDVTTRILGHEIHGFLELDFILSSQGDEKVSNSFNPRLRHFYFEWDRLLIGQTWSTFQDVSVLPESMDFIGVPDGTTFMRQSMVRYTNGNWEWALENPETTITPNGGGTRIVSDDGSMPDLVARYTFPLDGGHIKLAGLARQLDYDIGGVSDSESSLSVSLSGKHAIGDDDIRWMVTTGSGVGRYLGLNTANGAVFDAAGNLEAIDQTGWFIAYRHIWNAKWRSSFMYSALSVDNDTALTGTGVTSDVWSANVNLVYEPVPKLTLGGEIMFAEREIESGLDGDMTRFIFSAKYAF